MASNIIKLILFCQYLYQESMWCGNPFMLFFLEQI
jgi:hypothetical protein